jgi:hypothetical protein
MRRSVEVGASYARVVKIDVEPRLEPAVAKALAPLLEGSLSESAGLSGDGPWRRAGLDEAVEGVEDSEDYALLPRSTRGATRA